MKRLVCEMCGSEDLIKEEGVFVCQNCGCKYSPEEAKKMMVEGTVDVSGSTVKVDNSDKLNNLYTLARRARDENNSEDASKYYNQIAVEDTSSWEAQFYKVYYTCMQTKIAYMGNSCVKLSNTVESTFNLIAANISDSDEQLAAYREVYGKSINYAFMIVDNITKQMHEYSDPGYALKFTKEQSSGVLVLIVKLGDECKKVGLKEEAVVAYKAYEIFLGSSVTVMDDDTKNSIIQRIKELEPDYTAPEPPKKNGGCYIATAVYGSYDCPQVWTLRRYRDYTLAESWYGRAFIHAYYAVSPTIVKCLGDKEWFKKLWRRKLNQMIEKLNMAGVDDSPYEDRDWK